MTYSLSQLRQSAAELLACVVVDLFPGALLVEGGGTEFGFYYDFVAEQPIDKQALSLLEEKMRGLIKENHEIRQLDMMRENAISFFEHKNQPLVAHRLSVAHENIVSIFQIDEFYDYCPQSHVLETFDVGSFKLLSIDAIERHFGDEGLIPVIRIQGAVYSDLKLLKKFVKARDAGKKREHLQFNRDLKLLQKNDLLNSHAWIWNANGEILKEVLVNFWKKEQRNQHFQVVATPPLLDTSLLKKLYCDENWVASLDDQGFDIQGTMYSLPINFGPAHAALYHVKERKAKELPLRFAECGPIISRDHEVGLWGALNSQFITADEANVFCRPDQVVNELISSLQFINKITKIFSFECHWHLKASGQKSASSSSRWKKGCESFITAFEKCGLDYTLDEHESSYPGPRAELHLIDAVGREWKGAYIGINFNYPDRLGLTYVGEHNETYKPVMVTQSFFKSLERFVAMLLEQYTGWLPLWLAPEQIRVLPVKENNNAYANSVCCEIEALGFRVHVNCDETPLSNKIHQAENDKVPYLIIVGEKEEKQHLITVRSSIRKTIQQEITFDVFFKQLQEEVIAKLPPEKQIDKKNANERPVRR